MKTYQPALLALEDGTLWHGRSFGATADSTGEIVFNTSLTGYQEILTDPSYRGQIITMTMPHIGNTGVNPEDEESGRIGAAGLIVRSLSPVVSNWRAKQSLPDYLAERGVAAMTDVDTRALVRHIRTKGAMRAAFSTADPNPERLLVLARSAPDMNGLDLVPYVTCPEPYHWAAGQDWWPAPPTLVDTPAYHVVAYDFGIKRNILRLLAARGCRITVVPATTTAADALALEPDGIFLSNGPGDPAAVTYAIDTVRQLLGQKPIFGICLGHQILALALGARSYKLKFGHRGGNQPVGVRERLETGRIMNSELSIVNGEREGIEERGSGDGRRVLRDIAGARVSLSISQSPNLFSAIHNPRSTIPGGVQISSHNHGFAIDPATLPAGVVATQVNLNDDCCEGLEVSAIRAFSVQYHPESSPGPHDSDTLFDKFIALIDAK